MYINIKLDESILDESIEHRCSQFILVIITYFFSLSTLYNIFQFRIQPKTWCSYGTQRIPSWLIQRLNCRSLTYRTTIQAIVRSNTRPETSPAYRLSSIYAGDWAITCSTHTSRPR